MVDTNILLVDDDEDTCASMSDVLREFGYTVDQACDGPSALELSEGHRYRLALLDFSMPGMDGLELCRRLKASQPRIVVALVTAFASVATTRASVDAGIRCSLPKPVDFTVLMRLVEDVVTGPMPGNLNAIGPAPSKSELVMCTDKTVSRETGGYDERQSFD